MLYSKDGSNDTSSNEDDPQNDEILFMAIDDLNLDQHVNCGVPKFDGSNFTIWSFRMMT